MKENTELIKLNILVYKKDYEKLKKQKKLSDDEVKDEIQDELQLYAWGIVDGILEKK